MQASTSPPRADPHAAAQAAQRAAADFLTPSPRAAVPSLDFLPQGRRLWVDADGGRIALAESGQGPTVLLLHGWEGRASDLAAFAGPLLDAGFRVVAMNLPAHGESEGLRTSIPDAAHALLDVQRKLGPLHAVLAHSVGCAVAVEAMARGLQVRCAVWLAAPAHYADHARAFAARAGLDAAGTAAMIEALVRMGVDVRAVSLPRRARALRQPALFVHSADDRVVPIEQAAESAAAWPGAQLLRLQGLGHRALLQAPQVVAAALDFVRRPLALQPAG